MEKFVTLLAFIAMCFRDAMNKYQGYLIGFLIGATISVALMGVTPAVAITTVIRLCLLCFAFYVGWRFHEFKDFKRIEDNKDSKTEV